MNDLSQLTETQYEQLKNDLNEAYKDIYSAFDKKDFNPKNTSISSQIHKHFGLIVTTSILTIIIMAIARKYEKSPSINDYLTIPF